MRNWPMAFFGLWIGFFFGVIYHLIYTLVELHRSGMAFREIWKFPEYKILSVLLPVTLLFVVLYYIKDVRDTKQSNDDIAEIKSDLKAIKKFLRIGSKRNSSKGK